LRRVLDNPGVRLAILFGSYARGEACTLSDIDLLVDSDYSISEPVYEVSRELNIPVDKADLMRLSETPAKVLVRALREGIVVVSRDAYYRKVGRSRVTLCW